MSNDSMKKYILLKQYYGKSTVNSETVQTIFWMPRGRGGSGEGRNLQCHTKVNLYFWSCCFSCTVIMNKMQIMKGGRDSCTERIESTTF